MANAFEEVHLTVEVPIVNDETRYTQYGDFFAVLCVVSFIFIFIIGITVNIVKKVKSSQESD
jgi:apolipoprotein N-acyltransferase